MRIFPRRTGSRSTAIHLLLTAATRTMRQEYLAGLDKVHFRAASWHTAMILSLNGFMVRLLSSFMMWLDMLRRKPAFIMRY
jgi:hypothetical protein